MDLFNKEKINKLEQENIRLLKELEEYKNKLVSSHFNNLIAEEEKTLNNILDQIESIKHEKELLSGQLKELRKENIIDLSEIEYTCTFSSQYKQKIDYIRQKQKNIKDVIIMTEEPSLYLCNDLSWLNQVIGKVASAMQITFDLKCDDIMSNVKYNDKKNLTEKITNLATRIERQNSLLNLKFNDSYIKLKIDEIYMVFEYKCKLQLEKEEKDREREILKDQTKADKEIQRKLEKEEKELINLKYKYNKLVEQNKDTKEIQYKIDELEESVKKDTFMLTNKKCGYVYVVGNRDMKDGLVKIGVTKREVEDRMSELGTGASHSFPMEVYGYVFVDDCYNIESQLHRYMAKKRLNVNNSHKEWFIATLDEIKQAFKTVCNIDIDLSEKPCEDYLASFENFLDFY